MSILLTIYFIIYALISIRFLLHTGVLALPIPNKQHLRRYNDKRILIQYPVRNEPLRLVERFIKSLETIPEGQRHRYKLQILDDYDDKLPTLTIKPCVEYEIFKREKRTGNKAGNMNFGLEHSDGFDFLLVFDADHQVDGRGLYDAANILYGHEDIVCVQSRWIFDNKSNKLENLFQQQVLGAHIEREQTFRSYYNIFPIFNGAGGMWKISYLKERFGGFLTRCVCEDTDTSGEANMDGKRIVVLPTWTTRVDLVDGWKDYEKQQHRWIKGNGQQFAYHWSVKSKSWAKKMYWMSWNAGFALAPLKYPMLGFGVYRYLTGQSILIEQLAMIPHVLAWIGTSMSWNNTLSAKRLILYPTQYILELRVLHAQISGWYKGFFSYKKHFDFEVTRKV